MLKTLQQLNQIPKSIEEKTALLIKETIQKELRNKEVESMRRRRRRIMIMLSALGITAAAITIAAIRIPWLWAIMAIIGLLLLRR